MNTNKRETSSSPAAYEEFQKRQKMTSSFNNLKNMSSNETSNRTRLDELQSEISNLFKEDREDLLNEAETHKQEIESLKIQLAETKEFYKEMRAARVATAETKMEQSRKISGLKRKIMVTKSQADHVASELRTATSRIIALRREITSHSASQERSDATELQEANRKIMTLESEKESLSKEMYDLLVKVELAEKFKEKRGNTREEQVPFDEVSSSNEILNEHEFKDLEELVRDGNARAPQLSRKPSSIVIEIEDDADERSRQHKFSYLITEIEDIPANQKILVKDKYVLPSDLKFFEIKSGEHYQQIGPGQYVCRECGEVKRTKLAIEDHVWIEHNGGTFKCPHCSYSSRCKTGRYAVTKHMTRYHP